LKPSLASRFSALLEGFQGGTLRVARTLSTGKVGTPKSGAARDVDDAGPPPPAASPRPEDGNLAGDGTQTPVISGTSGRQPPKSFVDSEAYQEDPGEPNLLMD
jgi:hypothetical protein